MSEKNVIKEEMYIESMCECIGRRVEMVGLCVVYLCIHSVDGKFCVMQM